MKPYKLCYYSATSMEIDSLSRGVQQYQQHNSGFRILARTQTQLFDQSRIESFVKSCLAADIIIITLHGGKASCPAFDKLIDAINQLSENKKKPYLHIQPTGGDEDAMELAREHSTDFGKTSWDQINLYLTFGGFINYFNMLLYLSNVLAQENFSCKPPCKLPHEGIYCPDTTDIPFLDHYIKTQIDPNKLTVGLWFNQAYWLNNNLAHIDELIRMIEKKGANVLPVFHLRYKDVFRNNKGADYIVEHFFYGQR
ncbi:MAG: hypothetical protein OMM_02490 [Candidatus Magnetoglobus multicellularis str. Araruama]|uniref:CobN/magnesium chelatase domain-containing protein n=1 Tax=Candidatus Magnetoglobus multicellularis str. Araruama TaxID=890399 RepID=A0A1V1P9J0_9BACT|nr:MAG: hypothetical protein OMM_02490 [Candidatus Magnetoglobus multicellularis str. Araruama]